MAGRKYGEPFWWVPTWHDGGANWVSPEGVQNVGRDIVQVLVDTNTSSTLVDDVPDQEAGFLIERIVGQRVISSNEAVAVNRAVHERVYIVDSNDTAINVRNLEDIDEAKSSWMWHQVSPWHANYNADAWGNWQDGTTATPAHVPFMGRHGHFDIGVKRRVESGTALIWHVQFSDNAGAEPVDNTFGLAMWCRVLLRMAI